MKLDWEATGSGVMCEGSPYIKHYVLHARVKKRHIATLIMMNGSWTLVPLPISLLLSLTLFL